MLQAPHVLLTRFAPPPEAGAVVRQVYKDATGTHVRSAASAALEAAATRKRVKAA